ncbi:MAG: hypothetical protein M3N43_06970, partial [Actinomycetota bacterium]|nr:hypothetical protein [Actinomycetota bacterium]
SITYRAMRGFYVLCGGGISSATTVVVTRSAVSTAFGFDYRLPVAGDSVFIFYENDTLKMSDDRWIRAGVSSVSATTCAYPASGDALTLGLSGTGINTAAAPLAGFLQGAPVRSFEITKLALYEADGAKWLGMCSGSGGACTLQPVVGPLADASGFLLTRYNDVGGVVTGNTLTDRNSLRSLRIRFIAKSEQAVGRGVGDAQRETLLDTLETVVTLRNVKQN